MALRIAGKKEPVKEPKPKEPNVPAAKEMDVPSDAPPDMPVSESDALPEPGADDAKGKTGALVDQATAGYKNPDMGPFMCANCTYFAANGPNTCQFVEGPIHELGYCNIFKSAGVEPEPDLGTEGAPPPDAMAGAPPPAAMPPMPGAATQPPMPPKM